MARKIIPPLDLMFYLTESPQSPKHVGAVQVFQLPPDAPDDYLLQLVEAYKVAPVAPPFNQRPHFPRLGLPEWREVEDMEISYHVRHSALPKPGTDQQLMEVVQRLHAGLLDRRRPGWMCQVIEGLEGNRFAVYSKVHHAYIDGMSGVKRMYGSLSSSPDDKQVVPTWSFEPGTTGNSKKDSRPPPQSTAGKLITQARGLAQAYAFLGDMGLQWLKLRDVKAPIPFSASRTRMNRPVEWETRSTAICSLPLDAAKAIGHKRNCTVNEVALAIIGAALNDYLAEHHEKPDAPLVAMCPVSLRLGNDDTAKTQVSAVHVKLGEPDVSLTQRLEQVVASSRAAKDAVSNLTAEAMMDYGVVIFALWELLERTRLDRLVTPSYNVLVSNVPGPGEGAMYLCGSKMLASYPISTFLPGVNLNATVLSHGNSLDFGLLGDRHVLPDLDIVAQRMVYHFRNLQRSVLGTATSRRPRANKAKARRAAGASAKPEKPAPAKRTGKPRARR